MSESSLRGGVLLRYAPSTTSAEAEAGEDAHTFVPAEVVVRVAELVGFTRVEGMVAPGLGIALAEGEVVTVLTLGDADSVRASSRPGARPRIDARSTGESWELDEAWRLPGSDRAVLCAFGVTRVAIAGAFIVSTGLFDAYEQSIVWRGRLVPSLDVRALYAQAEQAIWAKRAAAQRSTSLRGGLRPTTLRVSANPTDVPRGTEPSPPPNDAGPTRRPDRG